MTISSSVSDYMWACGPLHPNSVACQNPIVRSICSVLPYFGPLKWNLWPPTEFIFCKCNPKATILFSLRFSGDPTSHWRPLCNFPVAVTQDKLYCIWVHVQLEYRLEWCTQNIENNNLMPLLNYFPFTYKLLL